MPDITMCTNEICPKKKKCYRHEAEPSKLWQSYSEFNLERDGEWCFMPLYFNGEKNRKMMRRKHGTK